MIDIDSVSYKYPFQAEESLRNVSIRLEPGDCSVCTGISGCGKSTLIRTINGLIPHYYKGEIAGKVNIFGKDNRLRPVRETARSVGTLFQDPEQQFFAMTVEDEIAIGLEWKGFEPSEIRRRVDVAVNSFGLSAMRDSSVYELSEGQKQKVILAGLVAAEPEVLVLDEPTANLDPESTADLAFLLAELKANGTTIFISDHRLYWLNCLADHATVMADGETKLSGAFCLLSDPDVQTDFSLRKTRINDTRQTLPNTSPNAGVIGAESLSFAWGGKKPLFRNLGFGIDKGQTVAVTGHNGAGKTTLARLLSGLLKPSEGRILLNGKPARKSDLLENTALVLQNTDHQLYMRTVLDELVFSAGKKRKQVNIGSSAKIYLERFGLGHLAGRHPQSLSGGEKQRLVIACAMIRQPEILILDEPTSGLDGKNMNLMAENIKSFTDAGGAALLVTHDLELMEMVCTHRLDIGNHKY